MTRNPYAAFIMASLALQGVTTALFSAALGSQFFKLRREPLASATLAMSTLGMLSMLWWLAMILRAEASAAGFVLTAIMSGSIAAYGHFIIRTVQTLQAGDPLPATSLRDVWRLVAGPFLMGTIVGVAGHYWTYYVANPDSILRYLWLRGTLLLAHSAGVVACLTAMRRGGSASRRFSILLIGMLTAAACLLLDGALRLSLSSGASDALLAAGAVLSAFLGPFVLGVALFVASLELQRLHELQSSVQVQRSLEAALERERMMGLGRVADGLAHQIECRSNAMEECSAPLIAMGGLPASTREELDQLREAIDRAQRLTGRLKSIARARPVHSEPIAVGAFVRSTLFSLRAALPARISVSLVDSSVHTVRGDPQRLDQLLSNLIINARDAITGVGRVDIVVEDCVLRDVPATTRGILAPGQHVRMSIRDSGMGISPHILDTIFTPFFSTKGESGTGLGLATVASVVQEFRGAIAVESMPGCGSTFLVWLPAERSLAGSTGDLKLPGSSQC